MALSIVTVSKGGRPADMRSEDDHVLPHQVDGVIDDLGQYFMIRRWGLSKGGKFVYLSEHSHWEGLWLWRFTNNLCMVELKYFFSKLFSLIGPVVERPFPHGWLPVAGGWAIGFSRHSWISTQVERERGKYIGQVSKINHFRVRDWNRY